MFSNVGGNRYGHPLTLFAWAYGVAEHKLVDVLPRRWAHVQGVAQRARSLQLHVLRKVSGHGNITTTQRYIHPNQQSINDAGAALSAFLKGDRFPGGPT